MIRLMQKITNTPHLVAVIGNPIAHSRSPEIHQGFAKQFGMSINYQKILATSDTFIATIRMLKSQGAIGANITAPFKLLAFDYADILTERAKQANSVNTLIFQKDHCIGDNTDGTGLIQALTQKHAITIKNTQILIIGAGGSARGIIPSLLLEQPANITIANRTQAKALQLAKTFEQSVYQPKAQSFDLIINTSNASFDETHFLNTLPSLQDTCCYDLNYHSLHQPFYQWCKKKQAPIIYDGYQMLIGQAAESFYQWFAKKPTW